MPKGTIIKALSGFYYVKTTDKIIQCRARGKFRLDGMTPLVGDHVIIMEDQNGEGRLEEILPRKNSFIRPAVANIDVMVFIAANTNPITDPFLIDRVSVISEYAGCETVICINKTDIDSGEELYSIYEKCGFRVISTSALTGSGIVELKELLKGKISAFTGNSGVGKSSILNSISPELNLKVDDVSDKLGRGKHTTRHVELHDIGADTYIADTPGFASFDVDMIAGIEKEDLPACFPEFRPHLGKCRFDDCYHINEPDCSILTAVAEGEIPETRHQSYVRLFEVAKNRKDWENKSRTKSGRK